MWFQSQGWQRISHGTGMGHSSTTGYWIPKKPAYVPAPAKPKPPKLIKRRGSGVAFGRGRPRASRAAEGALDIDAEGANTEISVGPRTALKIPTSPDADRGTVQRAKTIAGQEYSQDEG